MKVTMKAGQKRPPLLTLQEISQKLGIKTYKLPLLMAEHKGPEPKLRTGLGLGISKYYDAAEVTKWFRALPDAVLEKALGRVKDPQEPRLRRAVQTLPCEASPLWTPQEESLYPDEGLAKSVDGVASKRVKAKGQRIPGTIIYTNAGNPISNEMLAKMRGDHEFRGMSIKAVAEKWGFSVAKLEPLLRYRSRALVRPE